MKREKGARIILAKGWKSWNISSSPPPCLITSRLHLPRCESRLWIVHRGEEAFKLMGPPPISLPPFPHERIAWWMFSATFHVSSNVSFSRGNRGLVYRSEGKDAWSRFSSKQGMGGKEKFFSLEIRSSRWIISYLTCMARHLRCSHQSSLKTL